MTNLEFDVLDELYFVQPFHAVCEALAMEEATLRDTLRELLRKGWVKCFRTAADEVFADELDFENSYRQYFYLATKAGLLAHNSR